jgi:hypothetical protein
LYYHQNADGQRFAGFLHETVICEPARVLKKEEEQAEKEEREQNLNVE